MSMILKKTRRFSNNINLLVIFYITEKNNKEKEDINFVALTKHLY